MANAERLEARNPVPYFGEANWLPVLMYHHVVPSRHRGLEHVEVTCDEFEQQMRYLKDHGYGPMALFQGAFDPALGKGTGRKPVVITFDDGYLDVFHHAFPILRKYGFTAHLFLVSSYLDGTSSPEGHSPAGLSLLGPPQLRDMADYGISFGSHSVTHRRLVGMGDQEAWEEVRGSKIALERILETPIDSFSYPHGCSNPELLRMVHDAGYLTACGIEQREHGLYNLSRIDASRCRGADLRWQVSISGLYFHLRRRKSLRRFKDVLYRLTPIMR